MADFNLTQVNSLSVLLQSEYDALSTKDPDTLYVAKASDESNVSNIYLGTKSMNDVIIINNPDTEDVNEGRLYITYDTNSVCLFTVEDGEIRVISSGGSGSVTLDDFLSLTSENGVMNKTLSWHTINDISLDTKDSTYPRPINNDTNYNISIGSFSVGYYNALNKNQDVAIDDDHKPYDGFLTIKNGAHLVYSSPDKNSWTSGDTEHLAGLSILTGSYNIPDNTSYNYVYRQSAGTGPRFRKWAFTVGNGYLDNLGVHRSNAASIGFDGNSYFQGDVYGDSEWNSSTGDISSARRLAYVDEIPGPGPTESNVVSFVVNYSDMSCEYDYDDVLEMITSEDAKDKIFIAYIDYSEGSNYTYKGPFILRNYGEENFLKFILDQDLSWSGSATSFVDSNNFDSLILDESGWSVESINKQSYYSQRIGTQSSHPAIGSASQPVYVNSSGQIVAGNIIPSGVTVDSSLSTTSENPVQNKVITNEVNSLDSRIDALSGHGKFLSTWNSTTGLPGTFPEATPYTYHTGDYYIVGNVSTTTNYKPSGTSYTGAASTEEETLKVEQNDTYWFDGFVWQLQKNNVPEIAIDDHLDDTSTNPVQNKVIKTYVDNLNGQILNVFTIQSSQWESTSGISPFKYSTLVTSTYDITLDTIVELFNDNPSLFSQYGFALGDIDISTNEIQIKSVRLPDDDVTLTCGFCGGAIENNPTTFESISISISEWEDLSDSTPFKYQVTKSTTYQFSGDTLVELMNDNPLLFANSGIVIGSLGDSEVTFWCIEKPASSISLSLSFKG